MVRKKTDHFWQYVDELPNNRWKCKFCGNEYPGHASRIKAHLGQVKNRGIEICNNVSEAAKEEALRALDMIAPDTQQQSIAEVEETTQWIPQGIGSENDPYDLPSFDYNLVQDNQFINLHNSSGEALHLALPESSSDPSQNSGLDPAVLHTQSEQADPLSSSSFEQQDDGDEVNKMTGAEQELQWQNINQLGVDKQSVSVCMKFDQSLLTLKRKLKLLSNQIEEKEEDLHLWSKKQKNQIEQKEDELYQCSKKLKNQIQEKEEELYQCSKKVKEIQSAYQNMAEEQRYGKHPSLEQLNRVEKLIEQVEEIGNLDMSEKETSRIAASSKTPLLASKLIGRDNEKSEIWGSLVEGGNLRLGVYGMGGVGKTEIMMNIYNELLNNKAFDNVFWVTMPKNFSIYELQGLIGSSVHLDELSIEHDEKIRAAILNKFLTSGKKYVIILDGLWRHFDYHDVGIPLTYDGLKLVITSRSLHVSRMMLCQATIKILPLNRRKQDDWELFSHELGVEIELLEEVTNIAQEVVRICEGLPLYIKAIATRMRGVDNVQEWNEMMEKMNNPKARLHELKGQVLDRLKLSYEFLNDHKLQQCLIFCAFYLRSRTDTAIEEVEVEEFLVDMGFIDGRNNEKKLLQAHNILRELERACLLDIKEEFVGETFIKMHSSILDMTCHVATEINLFTIDWGIALKDIAEEEFLIEDLDELYLMRYAANEISRLSSNELRHPILISKKDSRLRMIPNSLFTTFSELRILNLSGSKTEALPNSFSNLVNLTILVLQNCGKLHHIPNIGKLKSLRKLNLHGCYSLENLPEGLGNLVNLENLDLRDTNDLKLPEGVLRNLRKLQYLHADCVNPEELEGLTKLKKLFCRFSTLEKLAVFAGSFNGRANADIIYNIRVSSGPWEEEDDDYNDDYKDKRVVRLFGSIYMERDGNLLPENVQILRIYRLGGQRIIWSNCVELENHEMLEIDGCYKLEYLICLGVKTKFSFPSLRVVKLYGCSNLQGIVAPSLFPLQAHVAFPCLEAIRIRYCHQLEEIIAMSSSEMPLPTPTPALALAPSHFSHLTSLNVWGCHKTKRLLNYDILVHLSNLKSIKVGDCNKMEEVTSINNQQLTPLLNLKELDLRCLPELMSIGVLVLSCSIEKITVFECPKIKRIPLLMHQLANGVHSPPSSLKSITVEKEWWESLEWEQPEVKAALKPYVTFRLWVKFSTFDHVAI